MDKFFTPTPLYKEYLILDLIYNNKNITQRMISDASGISLSMVNMYLNQYVEDGIIQKIYRSRKILDYLITNKGIDKLRVLNIDYLKQSQKLYDAAKNNIESFLVDISTKNFKKILIYGAGEVSELFLRTINDSINLIDIDVIALIDDDNNKHGKMILDKKIISRNDINKINHDIKSR